MLTFEEFLTESPMNWVEFNKKRTEFIQKVLSNKLKDSDGSLIVLTDPQGLADTLRGLLDKQSFDAVFLRRRPIATTKGNISFGKVSESETLPISNKGDVAEGIFSSAVFARFLNRRSNGDVDPITSQDVIDIIKDLKSKTRKSKNFTSSTITKVVDDVNPLSQDTAKLKVTLSGKNFHDLVEKSQTSMKNVIESSVAYANSKTVTRYARFLHVNNKPNQINIIADGVGDQRGTKVDVFVTIDGRPTNLNVSLKVTGGNQFGQIGGSDFTKINQFFSQLGIDLSDVEGEYNKVRIDRGVDEAIKFGYDEAYKRMKKSFSGKKDSEVVSRFARGVEHFATLGDQTVKIVELDRGTFKQMSFKRFGQLFSGKDIDVVKVPARRPTLRIVNKTDGTELFELRSKFEKSINYHRNLILKRPGLSDLLQIGGS